MAVIVVQAVGLSTAFDLGSLFGRAQAAGFAWLGHAGLAAKVLIAWFAALMVAAGPRWSYWVRTLHDAPFAHRHLLPLVFQVGSFTLLFLLTYQMSVESTHWNLDSALPYLVWIGLLGLVGLFWLTSLAPTSFWIRFAREETHAIAFACAVGVIAFLFALVTQDLWDPLGDVTFSAVASLLRWFYTDVLVEPEHRIIGIDEFLVEIAAACSGYEGIGLVLILSGFYLFIFHKEFLFPQSLLLLPIGVVTIWSFNVARIAILVAIGAEISPELAVDGFHSLAGWIAFVLVTTFMLLLAHKSLFFSRTSSAFGRHPISFRMALLIPLVVLLATTLITSALTITVDWWYPLRVVLTGGALILLWQHYGSIRFRISWFAVGVGTLIFLLWVIMVPTDPAKDEAVAQQLSDIPFSLLVAWLMFRVVGAVVTVSLAEELAFRGYLFEVLANKRGDVSWPRFPWFALILSSVLFGLLHSAWLAGFLAGVAYGLVRCYRNNVGDAFVAHATTNGLLSIYVLITAEWSTW
ncbi:MAG TPA: exosortase E/protease, VPEID-CTERM system [Hydrogenophaga sp.]|uniref:exosortase E/protease, VPEID-CTERM system n=1 Tax=Hydrogenophaga sp. TaxID=1904254 RepID=UPI002C0E9530|nr:exosortase E/protease, VPEID-CTERM system [Hydrogenophaga sp.]HMN92017.1 exosortase E/protease, VPEID-CTERM system [Hydrogenophaga sp.]HMP08819.1 exosortase E/protease, VPEID-CTERM system [Hydrogenophaga sp.]